MVVASEIRPVAVVLQQNGRRGLRVPVPPAAEKRAAREGGHCAPAPGKALMEPGGPMMGLGPHLLPSRYVTRGAPMRHARATFDTVHARPGRADDHDGAALFYTMSGLFFALFAFAIWYCPRHL